MTRSHVSTARLPTVVEKPGPLEQAQTAFDGFMSFSLETRRPESCVCSLWAGYTASRAP